MQDFLKSLADPTRRAALAIIWQGDEHCVCELMARLDASQSRMSRHMKALREVGIVLDRRDAQWVRYRRNPDLPPQLAAVVDAVLAAEQAPKPKVA
ncbi:MAG: ArsR/SmtB family transcription factor [Brevirhabdus sp.]